jgi:hypothetical protein
LPQVGLVLGNVALNLAFGVGASIVADWLRPKQARTVAARTSRGISFDVTVGEQVPVSSLFGRGRVNGHLVFAQEYGENNEFAKFVVAMGRTPSRYDANEALLLDEKVRALSGSNADTHGKVVTDYIVEGTPHAWWKTYDGATGQTADAGLIAAAPTRWTSEHAGVGTPYGILTIRQNADIFGGSLPRIGSVWRGNRFHDWRFDEALGGEGDMNWADPSTWAWSENPAVLKWNYRRGLWRNGVKLLGLGFSQHAQDLGYYTAAANLADEELEFEDWTGARYAFGREISDDESPADVQRDFDRAMCGTSFDRGGADAPLPAQQHVAAFTVTDGDLLEEMDGRPFPVLADLKGTVSLKRTGYHGQFIDQDEDWAVRPYGTQISADLEELIGNTKLQSFDQPFEYRMERAQMRAQIELRKQLFPARRTETFGPRSNVLEPGDPFTRVMGEAAWGTMLGVVEKVVPLPGRIGNTVTWRQWDNTIIPDADEGFIEPAPAPGTPPVAPSRTLAVAGLNVVPYQRLGAGGTEQPYARASWTPITDPNVKQVMIRVWPVGGDEATDKLDFLADARLQSTKIFGPLAQLTDYNRKAIPVRTDAFTVFWGGAGSFTTGAEKAAVNPEVLEPILVGSQVLKQMGQLRSLIAQWKQIGTTLEQMDRENYHLRNAMSREIMVEIGNTAASFAEIIEVTVNPLLGALATRVDSLYAAHGGNTSQINQKWNLEATEDGYGATYGLQLAVNADGLFRAATMFADVPTDPDEPTRWGFMAGQFVWFTSLGVPIAAMDEDGHQRSANGVVDLDWIGGGFSITVP